MNFNPVTYNNNLTQGHRILDLYHTQNKIKIVLGILFVEI